MMLRNNVSNHGGVDGSIAMTGDLAGRQAAMVSPLIEVLWRRRWTMCIAVAICMLLGGMYLAVASRVYRATARISVQQNGPKVFSENQGFVAESDSFLTTQADVFTSTPVLQRALEMADYKSMSTFAGAGDDAVSWLWKSGALKAEAGKRSDIVSVSMDSTNPDDAAKFANAVVNAYLAYQGDSKRMTGNSMVTVLEGQKAELVKKCENDIKAMQKIKASSPSLSLNDDKNNGVYDRAAALATTLTNAEIDTIQRRADLSTIKAATASPATIANYVEAQQSKAGRDSGDREYDDLRSQLTQYELAITTTTATLGANNSRVGVIKATVDSLKKRIEVKQKSMIDSMIDSQSRQLDAAEQKERELRAALKLQQGEAIAQDPMAIEWKKLQTQVERLQKQIELFDGRINEVTVNTAGATLNASIVEVARAEKMPIRPSKSLALAAALMAGLVFGAGGAMFREWQDARLRSADEINHLLGVPVLASIPRTNPRLSSVAKGQLVRLDSRSAASEAYRSVRTTLHLGAASVAKTILVASPTSGDGKSTTASNLAIAFAEAGDRTLLIDCDLRRPTQHLIFEIVGHAGLSTVMSGEAKLRDAIVPTRSAGLFVLPCGPLPHNPTELLTSKRFGRLMEALAETFDRIIIDSPPLSSVADGRVLAAPADCTLLVFRMDHSMRHVAVQAVEGLEKIGANVIGAVANDVQMDASTRYYGGTWAPLSANDQMLLGRRHGPAQFGQTGGNAQLGLEHRTPLTAGTDDSASALAVNEPDWQAELR